MPDEELPPYTGDDTHCAKCGFTEADTEYRAHGRCHHDGGPIASIGVRPNERLHRQCTRCGYQWDEALVPTTTDTKDDA